MRDAQSLLEQVLISANGQKIDAELIRSSLGVADRAVLAKMFIALTERKPSSALNLVKEVHDRGLDLKRFGDALIEYSRDLLIARLLDDPNRILDRPADEVSALMKQSSQLDAVNLERLFEQLCKVVQNVGQSPFPRFALEIGLASIAEAPARLPVQELMSKLESLESKLSGSNQTRPSTNDRRGAASGGAAPSRSFRRSY